MALFRNARCSWRLLAVLLLIGVVSCRKSNEPHAGAIEQSGATRGVTQTEPSAAEVLAAATVDPSDLLFNNGLIPEIRIELKKSQETKLREDLRKYAKCTIVESLPNLDDPASPHQTKYTEVAIKVKGAAGVRANSTTNPPSHSTCTSTSKGRPFMGWTSSI